VVRPEMLWRFLEWTAASFRGRDGDERRHVVGDGVPVSSCSRRHVVGDGVPVSSCSVRLENEAGASFIAERSVGEVV
jgi:hypothetical protein